MPDCFVVRWLCAGAWAWLPGDWPVGLLTAVYHQAVVQQTAGPLTWSVVLEPRVVVGGLRLPEASWVIAGGRN